MRGTLQFGQSAGRSALQSAARWVLVLLLALGAVSRAHAGATLLLEEPYSYDGAFAGTGHVAVYLSHVCSASPVILRPCAEGESGVVLSRYHGIAGYDWVAIPLLPYLYAVERPEAIPLFSDAKVVAFLRDRYRREHLETLAADLPDGSPPPGNWYEMVGSAYDRTIYAFEIETSAQQDALLIAKFNREPNRERYQFIKRNCADFVREVIDFYYPHAVHRSVIGDLGVTTPKQIAKMLQKYSRKHPELESSEFVVTQVPGAVGRSKPVHGVLESVMAAKKYMLPLLALHPYVGGGLLAEYFGHRRFEPGKNDPVMNSDGEVDVAMTRADRVAFQNRLDEIRLTELPGEDFKEGKNREVKSWERVQAKARIELDPFQLPALEVEGNDPTLVGLTRANVAGVFDSSEFAARLMEARLSEELRPAATRKTSRREVNEDLALFQKLLTRQRDFALTPASAHDARARALGPLQ